MDKIMKTLVAIGAIGMLATGLFAQGTNFDGQTRESWEEINFEFNSSILSDGYPSLLRMADLLGQHKDYRVKVTGNTDYVGSAAYNEKLALQRADAVKAFLVKYGAMAEQITTSGDGKRDPEVNNESKEGRFMNRRVRLEVRDGQGKVIGDGRISEILPSIASLQEAIRQNADCCAQVLKRLDKLDDILAALNNMKGENDSLKTQIADLRNQQNSLRDQVNGIKPLTEKQTSDIAHKEANDAAMGAIDEVAKRNQKFSMLAINVGPNLGKAKGGDASLSARGQFFSPFGGSGTSAVQAQGEFFYNSSFSSEGQFDLGLVHRMGPVQAGLFGSVKYLSLSQYQQGGALAQGTFMVDYVFKGGRFGVFGTQGFKNYAVLNNALLYTGVYNQTYARIINQYGFDGMIGVWGGAYLQGNLAILRRGIEHKTTAGGEIRLVQPITPHVAFTLEGDFNETLVASTSAGRLAFGLQLGNFTHPKEYASSKSPVPMDVPRIRFELGTRRVGTAAPVADAGPNQINIPAQVVTLDGSGSYDPLGETLTYQWQQINGPTVAVANATSAKASFTASAGNSYGFRLTVTNTDGLKGTASTMVSTQAAVLTPPTIVQFTANPAFIQPGQSSTLLWVTQNVTTVSIAPGIGAVSPAASGSIGVSPTTTTTYTLTATGPSGTTTQTATVTVGTAAPGNPQILMFTSNLASIQPGQQVTLNWATSGATTATISGLGSVALNGSTTVTPTVTTTYTLTATSSDGKSVTAALTITVVPLPVAAPGNPQILMYNATATNIQVGQSSTLSWTTSGASTVNISGIGNVALNGSTTVSPTTTTTYTLTATSSDGKSVTSPIIITVVPVPVTPAGNPQILLWTANPATIQVGQQTTLSWTTSGGATVSISGVGNVALNGSTTVSPTATTTYTLTVTSSDNKSVTSPITVTVNPVPVTPPGNPQIVRFDASPLTIQPGQQSSLSWTTTGASTVTISGVGSVALNGSTTVSPTVTTTYTLTATSSDGHSVTSSIVIAVVPATVPQINAFTAVPSNINAGDTSKVCWQVTNATSISITGIGSNLNANDCSTVSPSTTTTYTLTATNASGSTSGNVTVNVGSLKILSFTATPPWSPQSGSPITLSWTTQGATSVVVVGGNLPAQSNLAVNGSITINQRFDETYTLTAYGPGGQTVSTTISVAVQ
jgi:hypothetical protein